MNEELAIHDGDPAVTVEKPHFEWPLLDETDAEAVKRYITDGRPLSIDGKEDIVADLEEDFADWIDVEYALSTNAGTTALYEAYFALDLDPGDEVIAPAYTFLATVTPLFHVNAVPVLADADPVTGNVSPESIRENVTEQTAAIVVTHMWGHPAEMDEIMTIADEHDLQVVEDCSHAHGAEYRGRKVGTFGDVAAFSLQGKKMLQGGEGGLLVTDDEEIYQRALMLGHYRNRTRDEVDRDPLADFNRTGYGLKFRIHPLAALIAHRELDRIDERIAERNAKLSYFTDALRELDLVEPPETQDHVFRGAYYGYKPRIRTDTIDGVNLEDFIRAMDAENMKAKRPGSKPLNRYPLFQRRLDGFSTYNPGRDRPLYEPGDFEVAERHWGQMVSMPPFLSEETELVDQYVAAFRKIETNIDQLR